MASPDKDHAITGSGKLVTITYDAVTKKWFAVLDGNVIASATTRDALLDRLKMLE